MADNALLGATAARVARKPVPNPNVLLASTAVRVLRKNVVPPEPVSLGSIAIRVLRGLWEPPPPARPDDWGPLPSEDLDWWTIAHQQGGVEPVRSITVEVPGSSPVDLEITSGTVTKQLGTGYAYTAKIDVVPNAGVWKLVATPGAIFRITFGWRFGTKESQVVTRGMGVYLLAEVPEYTRAGSIGLNLVDLWKRVEDSRFPAPWTAATGQTRATAIAGLIFNAQTRLAGNAAISATGGDIDREFTVERERTEAVTTLARDGRIRAYFDGNGSLRVDPDPVLAPERAVATFKDGDGATILELSREVEFTRLYNAVIVNPITDSEPNQSWEPVTVQISDPDHPRHPSKIGLVPGFFSSPSLTTRHAAMAAGITRLQSIMQELETVSIETWARPDIEPADTISTVETATYASEHRFSSWLVTESEFDLIGLGTKVSGRSTALGAIEEGDNEDD